MINKDEVETPLKLQKKRKAIHKEVPKRIWYSLLQ